MAVLSHQQILSLHGAVVSANLPRSRAALLGGMDPAFADSLPICASPSSQLLSDLHALNAAERLRDGEVPLTIWLANALALVGSRSEAEIFQSALAAAGNTLARTAQRGDEIAEELTRIGRSVFLARGNDLKRSLYEVEALLARCPQHVEARLLRERIKHAVDSLWAEEWGLRGIKKRPWDGDDDDRTALHKGSRSSSSSPYPGIEQYRRREGSFTGRVRELRALTRQLGTGWRGTLSVWTRWVRVRGVLVTGLAGAGKTALSFKLLQALAPRYPDLQIAIDLEGTNPTMLSPAAAMEKVVRAFLPGVPLPERAEEIAGLYHGVLRGHRALILLDDAPDGFQIEALLPPPGSVLLVTSRWRFALPGVHSVTLDRLEANDAQALLEHLAPRIHGAKAGEIAELCGGLPLALQLAGGALAMRPDISPDAYVARLQDAQGRHEQIDAELSVSFDLLDPVLQMLWSHLGFSTFAFSESDAVAMTSDSFPGIYKALSDLVVYGMLEYDAETELYTMPRAARGFAVSRLSEEDRVKAERRCESLSRTSPDHRRAVSRGGVEGALRAARRARYRLAEAVYLDKLPWVVDRQSVELAEQAVGIFRELGQRDSELRTLERLMVFYTSIEDHRRCVAICEQRLARAGEQANRHQQVRVLHELGQYHEKLGELDKAIAAAQSGVDIGHLIRSPWLKKSEDQLQRLLALRKT